MFTVNTVNTDGIVVANDKKIGIPHSNNRQDTSVN